ncbi:uncharacterized protein EV420DRAFT_1126065 [Desarmillaria tabescens]|uniref:BTB domain-containing protein n=1 Tax=Armillaria tabescens TaxID=1929756 RepID=A0AA39MPE8_ARMTA|nr:uncharacterized protein EV420DRAFT_1126065 [Desarmillaria tabescens]KAK0440915.1 hypothetical protein EV420DRAFT_1126065 [Desarmillaria tabescens]
MPGLSITSTSMSSSRFSYPDADTSIYSSDGILFRLHRINITLNSHIPLQDGRLPESSRILELLFQFLYNQPQPDLAELTFAVLLPLAEAAHKYRVYAAISSCRNAIRCLIPAHSLPILSAALKWKDRSLVDEAAKHTIALSAEEIVRSLDSAYLAPWILYHRSWMSALSAALRFRDPISRHWEGTKDQVGAKPMANPCEVWTELWATVAFDLEGHPEKLIDGGSIWRRARETLGLRCTACEVWLDEWEAEFTWRMGKVPGFWEVAFGKNI